MFSKHDVYKHNIHCRYIKKININNKHNKISNCKIATTGNAESTYLWKKYEQHIKTTVTMNNSNYCELQQINNIKTRLIKLE